MRKIYLLLLFFSHYSLLASTDNLNCPTVSATVSNQIICSGGTTMISLTSDIADTTFNWQVTQSNVTGASDGSGNLIAQTITAIGISSGTVTYTIIPFANNCYGTPIQVTITVNAVIDTIVSSNSIEICSEELAQITVTSSQQGLTYDWSVVQTNATGASSGSLTTNTLQLNESLHTISSWQAGTVTYTITPHIGNCFGNPITVTVVVNPLPHAILADGSICVDSQNNIITPYVLDSNLPPDTNNLGFQWYFNGVPISGANANTYVVDSLVELGIYSITVINYTTACVFYSAPATVTASLPAQSLTVEPTEQPDGTYTLTVTVNGNSNYIFQLDNGQMQESNIFTDVPFGFHSISVTDTNGCTNLISQIDLPEITTQGLTVGPNPITDVVTIQKNKIINKVVIQNQLGQTVLENDYNSKNIELNLSHLNAGIYFISVASDTTEKRKIVKN